jgi:tetratricopeptide (TPR) repeat protein
MRLASRASIAGDNRAALEFVSQGRELAEELEWDEGLCDSLSLLGLMRVSLGEPGGIEDIGRGIEIGKEAGAYGALLRAYNSKAVAHQILGLLDAGYEARREGALLAEQIDSPLQMRWFESVMADHHYRRGDWDEAQRIADEYLGEVEAGSPHYNAWQDWLIRALIRLARGDAVGAVRDAERALELGRAIADPQAVYYVLPACAYVFARAGEEERAVAPARELIDALKRGVDVQFAVINFPLFAAVARDLGLLHEVVDALGAYPDTLWTEVVRAYGAGDFVGAAETLRRIGDRPDEADARLRAAEQLSAEGRTAEADEQLQQALAFYRSVGATRFVTECEALLPASA